MNDTRRFDDNEVRYIYGQVQTKTSKEKEILREYGYEIRKCAEDARKRTDIRPFGKAFAQEQMKRARPKRATAGNGRTTRTDGGGYIYRPARVSHDGGGVRVAAAEHTAHLKLIKEKIINLFESIEERGKNDERIAKRRAVIEKKWSENKNNIITAIVLVLLTIAFFLGTYKLFFVVRNIDAGGSSLYSPEEIAAASGIEIGENLYSFRASEAEAEITFRCPYLKIAEVSRTIPKNVNIYVEDDEAVYAANIWGDYVELSAGLKVLGKTTEEAAERDGLTVLVLPPVKYSVAGRQIEFSNEKNSRLVRDVISEIDASSAGQAGSITMIDLTDEHDIKMEANGIYSLKFGGESDLGLKLRMMYKTITSGSLSKDVPASIDLTTVGEACVRYDF